MYIFIISQYILGGRRKEKRITKGKKIVFWILGVLLTFIIGTVGSIYILIHIYGHGMDKINHGYAFGNAKLAVKTLNENFDLNISEFVAVNFTTLPFDKETTVNQLHDYIFEDKKTW